MNRKLSILTIILSIAVSALFGQNDSGKIKIEKLNLQGEWIFESVTSDSENCNLPDTFPILTIIFTKTGEFTITGQRGKVSGKYEIVNNIIRMFDAKKNGTPQKGDNEMTISSLTDIYLTLEMNMECAMTYPKYKKKE